MIHGLSDTPGQAKRPIMDLYIGVMPFFLAMIGAIVLLMIFPEIALWLPRTMKGN